MNNSRKLISCITASISLGILGFTAQAADISLLNNNTSGEDWNTAADWSNNESPSAANNYFVDARILRTPDVNNNSSTPVVFGGNSLTLQNTASASQDGRLALKANFTTVNALTMSGGEIFNSGPNGGGSFAQVNVGNLTIEDVNNVYGGTTARNVYLFVGSLTGSGDLSFGLSGDSSLVYGLSAVANNPFTGTINAGASAFRLRGDVNISNGSFWLGESTVLNLESGSLAVASASFILENSELTLTDGTYSAADLNTFFGTSQFEGEGLLYVGVNIPEPGSAAMVLGCVALLLLVRRRR